MNDTEKIKLIIGIMNCCWENEPRKEEMLCGYYFGVLNSVCAVLDHQEADQ